MTFSSGLSLYQSPDPFRPFTSRGCCRRFRNPPLSQRWERGGMSARVRTLPKKKKGTSPGAVLWSARLARACSGAHCRFSLGALLCVCVCVFPLRGLSSALYQSHYEIVCVLANPFSGARLFTVDQPLPSITWGSYQHSLATHSPLSNWQLITEFSWLIVNRRATRVSVIDCWSVTLAGPRILTFYPGHESRLTAFLLLLLCPGGMCEKGEA